MSSVPAARPWSAVTPPPRVASIDIFRGLTILLMIFVNHLARHEMIDIPAWLKHAPGDVSVMTIVDVVFPAFLFIVGMAIPLALDRRMDRGEPRLRIAGHVIFRSVGLLIIGVLMCNIGPLNPVATGLSKPAWTLLMFVGVVLVWNHYPRAAPPKKHLWTALRVSGALLLVVLAAMYRGNADGEVVGLRTYWWGILGLIGWAYLACTLAYVLARGNATALMGVLGLFVLLYVGDSSGALNKLEIIKRYLWLGGHLGGHATMTMAGLLVTLVALKPRDLTVGQRIGRTLIFAGGLLLAGWLMHPAYGVSKQGATPSWALYCSAICCAVWVLLYWIADVWGQTAWAAGVQPAAVNPLLAYILPDILFAILGVLGITRLDGFTNEGGRAILRAAIFAIIVIAATAALTRLHVRLRL